MSSAHGNVLNVVSMWGGPRHSQHVGRSCTWSAYWNVLDVVIWGPRHCQYVGKSYMWSACGRS